MKHIFASLSFILLTTLAIAQAPAKFNYQGIARNNTGAPLAGQALGLRITIHDLTASGATVYQETFTTSTNAYGLYTAAIGTGTIVSGTMAGIDWSTGDKFIQVEIDPAGGSTYADAGTTQLLSVPYATYANTAKKISMPYNETLANTNSLVRIENTNTGAGIEGANSNSGVAVLGSQTATTGSTIAVKGVAASTANGIGATGGVTGVQGEVSPTAPGGYSAGLRGVNKGTGGTGIGVIGYQAGSGWGVYGETPSGFGVYGLTTNSSAASSGVRGETFSANGIGVEAKYSGSGVGIALEVDNGAIRVAGVNKAAFVHTATVANKLSANGTDVDNPLCNGDATAILIVTQKLNPSGIVYNNSPIGVYYNTIRNKWEIFNQNNAAIPTNAQFNVLVIKQ